MKYIVILTFLIACFYSGLTALNSEELLHSKSPHQYREYPVINNSTHINQDPANNPKNLIVTKSRFSGSDLYSKSEIGLMLMKNDEHFGLGIALIRPLFDLF